MTSKNSLAKDSYRSPHCLKQSEIYNQSNSITSSVVRQEDRSWITVFGFDPDNVDFVKSKFEKFGVVARSKIANQSTWIHICYSSELEAQKALRMNGRMFKLPSGQRFIIGVVQKPLSDFTEAERSMESSNSTVGRSGSKIRVLRPMKEEEEETRTESAHSSDWTAMFARMWRA
ncbi:hypothetical protein ACOME3_005552 [Neoechinorhynchus agilis]